MGGSTRQCVQAATLLSGLCNRAVAFERGETIARGPSRYVLEHRR